MRTTAAAAVAAGTLLALAGCTAPVPHPSPPSADEVAVYIEDSQATQWFYSLTPLDPRPQLDAQLIAAPDFDDVLRACGRANQLSDVECSLSYLQVPGDIGYLGSAELGYLYDYFADSHVPCLAVRGLRMTYMPTRAEYTAQAGLVPWDPYTQLGADLPPSRADDILADCPRYPPMPYYEGAWQ